MDELLKEVVLSDRRNQQINVFIQTLTKLLQNVPVSPIVEVCTALNSKQNITIRHKITFILLPLPI